MTKAREFWLVNYDGALIAEDNIPVYREGFKAVYEYEFHVIEHSAYQKAVATVKLLEGNFRVLKRHCKRQRELERTIDELVEALEKCTVGESDFKEVKAALAKAKGEK